MHIRDAVGGDAAGIAAIYNDAVAHSTAIWNDSLVSTQNRLDWLTERQAAGFPVVVAVADDSSQTSTGDGGAQQILGYATYGQFRPQDGFCHTVEHSVYVGNDQRGRGIGTALLHTVISRARASGIHVVVAAIDASNQGSIALHQRLGFTQVGLLPQVGTKFGAWLDLALLQLTLDPATATPPPTHGV